jgi:hypothetical protein
MVQTGVDVGPAIYIARTFETDIDTVVKYFIFILIFVFDPLAVSLVVAYNVAIVNRKRWEVYGETERKGIIDDSFSRYVNHRSDFLPKEVVKTTVESKPTTEVSKGGRKIL